jgi:hypothetical protein
VIVVERTEAFELLAGRVQSDIRADDVDNVVGFLDPFGQASPIVRQKTPVGRMILLGHPRGPMLPSLTHFFESDKEKQAAEGTPRKSSGRVKSPKKLRLSAIRIEPCLAYRLLHRAASRHAVSPVASKTSIITALVWKIIALSRKSVKLGKHRNHSPSPLFGKGGIISLSVPLVC